MIRTPARLVAAASVTLAAALTLSACGQVDPSAAAVLGSTTVAQSDLVGMVTRGLADKQAEAQFGSDKAGFTRQQLTRLIRERIVDEAAREHGVTISEGGVDKLLDEWSAQAGGRQQLEAQAAQNGVGGKDLRPFVRMAALQDALGDKLVENLQVDQAKLEELYKASSDQYDQVRAAHILVADKATADKILAQVKADPGSFADLAKKYSTDQGSKDNGGDLGFASRSQLVKPFADAAWNAKVGDFLVVQTQYGWHVIHVLEHRVTTLAQATPDLKRSILKDERDKRLQEALSAAAKKLGVKVNPRYGKWDTKTLTVVDGNETVSSPSPSAGGGSPTGGLPGGQGGGG